MKKISRYAILLSVLLLLGGCSLFEVNNVNNTGNTTAPEGTAAPDLPSVTAPPPSAAVSITPSPSPAAANTPAPTAILGTDRAEDILSGMSLEEKVGQMFFVRLDKANASADIKSLYPGGFIMFGGDFEKETKASIRELIKEYQKNSEIPLLIGVDEEGGTVNRVSRYPAFRKTPFRSPMDLYKAGGFDLIESDTAEKCELLLNLGINVNLAPVCDISTDPEAFIYKRSLGENADKTSEYVKLVVTRMKELQIGSTLKHFPGYGNNADTHTGIAVDDRSYDDFAGTDFLPFQAGIDAGADSILVSHNIVNCMDENNPASLSLKVHKIIREELNFNGVIMTDDLMMDAVKAYAGEYDTAVQAVLAGNDLLIATDYRQQIPTVLNAVKDGVISEARLDESVTRVLLWKLSLGLIK